VADALSRRPDLRAVQPSTPADTQSIGLSSVQVDQQLLPASPLDKWSPLQTAVVGVDAALLQHIREAQAARPPTSVRTRGRFLQEDGLWYRSGKQQSRNKLYVPPDPELRGLVLAELHGAPYSGHFGFEKSCERVSRLFFWPGLADDVRAYVRACIACQMNKRSNLRPAGELSHLPIPARRYKTPSSGMQEHKYLRVSGLSQHCHPAFAYNPRTPCSGLLLSLLTTAPSHAAGLLQDRGAAKALHLRAVAAAMLLCQPAALPLPFPAMAGTSARAERRADAVMGHSHLLRLLHTIRQHVCQAHMRTAGSSSRCLPAGGPRACHGAQAVNVTGHST
jgi:Integrase zinc binding domain